jgi:membrane associated rhomboid family serine protease
MYTGTGTENTDVGAHLMGFICGLAGGMLLVPARDRLVNPRLQIVCGLLAVVIVVVAWFMALQA